MRPVHVVIPYAKDLTFTTKHLRARRDQRKYLTLIRNIAFLHQYQRPIKTITIRGKTVEYIEATLDDLEIANRLAMKIFAPALDEVSTQTRTFMEKAFIWVTECMKK